MADDMPRSWRDADRKRDVVNRWYNTVQDVVETLRRDGKACKSHVKWWLIYLSRRNTILVQKSSERKIRFVHYHTTDKPDWAKVFGRQPSLLPIEETAVTFAAPPIPSPLAVVASSVASTKAEVKLGRLEDLCDQAQASKRKLDDLIAAEERHKQKLAKTQQDYETIHQARVKAAIEAEAKYEAILRFNEAEGRHRPAAE
jgi:hypothetical protein